MTTVLVVIVSLLIVFSFYSFYTESYMYCLHLLLSSFFLLSSPFIQFTSRTTCIEFVLNRRGWEEICIVV